jgi:IS30 family transposase
VLVLHERKSRVTLAARLTGKTAAETISAMLAVFGRINPHLRRSITFDNDTAFAQHGLLRTMRDMTTWFCDAYASWQKGGIENANGRLRRWLPRHLDIDRTSATTSRRSSSRPTSRPVNASGSRRHSKP